RARGDVDAARPAQALQVVGDRGGGAADAAGDLPLGRRPVVAGDEPQDRRPGTSALVSAPGGLHRAPPTAAACAAGRPERAWPVTICTASRCAHMSVPHEHSHARPSSRTRCPVPGAPGRVEVTNASTWQGRAVPGTVTADATVTRPDRRHASALERRSAIGGLHPPGLACAVQPGADDVDGRAALAGDAADEAPVPLVEGD